MLIPKDPRRRQNVMVEVRWTGGDEASILQEICSVYTKYRKTEVGEHLL
jgi:protein subunit release factor A